MTQPQKMGPAEALVETLAAMGVIPEQRVPLGFGLVSLAVLSAAYALRRVLGRGTRRQ